MIEKVSGASGDPLGNTGTVVILRELGESQCVAVDHPRHAFSTTAIASRICDRMQARDRLCDSLHHRQPELFTLSEPIEKRVLLETHHFDDPVDRLAGAA